MNRLWIGAALALGCATKASDLIPPAEVSAQQEAKDRYECMLDAKTYSTPLLLANNSYATMTPNGKEQNRIAVACLKARGYRED